MNLADLVKVKSRVLQLLNANRVDYTDKVGTGPNRNGAYPFDDEITDAVLEADALVIVEGYFQTQLSLRNRFLVASSNLADGDPVPEFDGLAGKVQYSTDSGVTWLNSRDVKSHADIFGANESGSYVGASSFVGRHFIDPNGYFYSTSPISRLYYPAYTRTEALQALEIHEPAVIAAAMTLLYKDRSQAAFQWYQQIFSGLVGRIKTGELSLPEVGPMPGGAA